MLEICKYIDGISRICKTYVVKKYAEICSFICKICKCLYIAYFAFICTHHFSDGEPFQGQKSLDGRQWPVLRNICLSEFFQVEADIFAFVSPVLPPTWLMADSAEYENKKHCVRWRGRPYFAPRGFAHARERVLLMKGA